jgi:ATP-dependent Clp protease protease subunit
MTQLETNSEEIELDMERAMEALEGMSIMSPTESWSPNLICFYGPDSRHICISGEITEELSTSICSQLQELAVQSPDDPIWVHINTPGGSVIDGLAIYDVMRMISCPIVTLVNGGALSCGLLLSQGGDIRLATTNSMFFYHQPVMGIQSIESTDDIEATHGFYTWCKQRLDDIIKKRSKVSKKTWKAHFENSRGVYFSASQALEYKMIDHILGAATAKSKKIKLEDLV